VREIIVGVDGSARGEDAMAFAETLGRLTGATLVLASAYPYEDWPSRAAGNEYREYLREVTEGMLDRMRGRLEAPDVPAHAIADPSPARALHLLAERHRASLIVVGSSHRGRIGRVLLGSTADRLMEGGPCPVAVVPHGYRGDAAIETVAVGYDGGSDSDAAVATASEVARRLDATLRVVRVFDAATVGTPALLGGPGYVPAYEEIEAFARDDLERRVAALGDAVRSEAVFLAGAAGRELAAQTEPADLMILGSRGYGPVKSVLLGGVSRVVLREAACPVIVLPHGARRGVDELFTESRTAGV
jgi:nucleotide-binding universal stress UspA family protein